MKKGLTSCKKAVRYRRKLLFKKNPFKKTINIFRRKEVSRDEETFKQKDSRE